MKAFLSALYILLSLFSIPAIAQDIHYLPFDATPLILNPAFTGMFDGKVRADAIYRSEWASVNVPYTTYQVSADMALYTDKQGNYLAAGVMFLSDQAANGGANDFSSILSLAYHTGFKAFTKEKKKNSDLAIGLQAGYGQREINLQTLYFGNQPQTGISPYHLGLGEPEEYYFVNAGLSFSQSLNSSFNYTIGLSGNNLNQPADQIKFRLPGYAAGLETQYALTFGANWVITKRLTLCPAIFYETSDATYLLIAGNEFQYAVGKNHKHRAFVKSIFLGGWYRTSDVFTATAGFQLGNFRIGLGYDYYMTPSTTTSNGNGGLQIQLRYIAPAKSTSKRVVPCNRF